MLSMNNSLHIEPIDTTSCKTRLPPMPTFNLELHISPNTKFDICSCDLPLTPWPTPESTADKSDEILKNMERNNDGERFRHLLCTQAMDTLVESSEHRFVDTMHTNKYTNGSNCAPAQLMQLFIFGAQEHILDAFIAISFLAGLLLWSILLLTEANWQSLTVRT